MIKELMNQINTELARIHKDFSWCEFAGCEQGDKILYGRHIGVNFYYDGKPIKATREIRNRVERIFQKYYSKQAKFYKARHQVEGCFIPAKNMLVLTILI